jgi:ribonuclease P protein component
MEAGSPASPRLPRDRRIRHGRDFQRAKSQGKRLAQGCLVLNWIPINAGSISRLGVITSRAVGGAVVRSRARRLLRECFRIHQPRLAQPVDVVLVARPSIAGRSLGEVQADFLAALRRAGLLNEPKAGARFSQS